MIRCLHKRRAVDCHSVRAFFPKRVDLVGVYSLSILGTLFSCSRCFEHHELVIHFLSPGRCIYCAVSENGRSICFRNTFSGRYNWFRLEEKLKKRTGKVDSNRLSSHQKLLTRSYSRFQPSLRPTLAFPVPDALVCPSFQGRLSGVGRFESESR